MVNSACVAIYHRWLPHVGAAEARIEAHAFARRFQISIDGPLAPLAADRSLDAILDDVAHEMGAP